MAEKHFQDGIIHVPCDDDVVAGDSVHIVSDTAVVVLYVDSATGDDDNDGLTPSTAFATFDAAVLASAAGNMIVLKAGHDESPLDDSIFIQHSLYVWGEGVGDNRPIIRVSRTSFSSSPIQISAVCSFSNIRFGANEGDSTSTAVHQIEVTSVAPKFGITFDHCEFIAGPTNQGRSVHAADDVVVFHDCVFKAQGTSVATRPGGSIYAPLARAFNCTFEGGTYGWDNPAEFALGWGNTSSGKFAFVAQSATSPVAVQIDMADDGSFSPNGTSRPFQFYPNGAGLIGHQLLSGRGLYCAGGYAKFVYVNSLTGTDDASSGYSYEQPLATLAYALANRTGVFVVQAGHEETLAADIVVPGDSMVIGEGTGDTRPAIAHSANGSILITSAGTVMANIRFRPATAASSVPQITAAQVGAFVDWCEFHVGNHDNVAGLNIGAPADYATVMNCTFKSVAEAISEIPVGGITLSSADDVCVRDCTFDGGGYGWAHGSCASVSALSSIWRNITLLRDSYITIQTYNYAYTIEALLQISTMTGRSGILGTSV